MKIFKKYYDTLKKTGITRTSDLPYGNKQAQYTITFILPLIDTSEGFYKMVVPAMALNENHPNIRCFLIGMEIYDPTKSINYYSPQLKEGLIKETDFMIFPFVSYLLEPIIEDIKAINPRIKIGYHVDFNYYHVPDSYPFSELYNNQEAHKIIENNMRIVDRVFMSNKNLADAIYEKTDEKYKKGFIDDTKIKHHPMLFNKKYISVSESENRDKPEKFRIGLITNPSHLPDLNYIKGVLSDILNQFGKKAEVVIIGYDGKSKGRNYLKNINFTYIPRVPIFEYYQRLKDLSLNIALIPAKDNLFNRTSKNFIKYIEFAQLEIPVIMSTVINEVIPDRQMAEHNGTALICKEKDNWVWELHQGIKGTEKISHIILAAAESTKNFDILLPGNMLVLETIYTFRTAEKPT